MEPTSLTGLINDYTPVPYVKPAFKPGDRVDVMGRAHHREAPGIWREYELQRKNVLVVGKDEETGMLIVRIGKGNFSPLGPMSVPAGQAMDDYWMREEDIQPTKQE